MFASRYSILGFGLFLESIGGLAYIYGHLSVTIKSEFHLKQSQVDYGALAQNIGGNIGVIYGPMYRRFGPKPIVALGGLLGFVGYLLLWLSISDEWNIHDNTWALYIIMFIIGQSAVLTDLAVIATVSVHFHENVGMALGLCKSFVGLSGSLNEQIYSGFFKPDTTSYVEFISIYFAIVCFICYWFIDAPECKNPTQVRTLDAHEALKSALKFMPWIIGFLVMAIVFRNADDIHRRIVCLCIFATFFIQILTTANRKDSEFEAIVTERTAAELQASLMESDEDQAEAEEIVHRDTTLAYAASHVEFWLQCLGCVAGWGSALLLINNMGQICTVVGLSKDDKDVFVSVVSISNCIGRILAGTLSDGLVKSGVHRARIFGTVILIMGFGMFTLSIANSTSFIIAAVVCGMMFGSLNALNPAVLGDIFGNGNLATIYGATGIAMSLGSFIFATKLFSVIYENHAVEIDTTTEEICEVPGCIRESAQIAGICCTIVGVAFNLYYMHRRPHAAS